MVIVKENATILTITPKGIETMKRIKKPERSWSYPIFLVVLITTCSFAWSDTPPGVGDKPYDFLGKDLQGNEIFVSDFQGKVVVVSFWATWCTYCLKELPVLESIQKQVSAEILQVIAVNKGEKKRRVRKIDKAFKEAGVELLLTHDSGGKTAKKWGVDGIPHLVMISKTGVISKIHVGYGEKSLTTIIDEINELLKFYVEPEA